MAYVSARYGPPPLEGEKQSIVAIDENVHENWFFEDSQVGDWLEFVTSGGTVEPYEAPPPPLIPPEEIIAPERDYGAEIDALDARVTALEAKS